MLRGYILLDIFDCKRNLIFLVLYNTIIGGSVYIVYDGQVGVMRSLNDLDKEHLEVLKEIGNIGMGNAATSLAVMLNHKVEMKMPEVSIVPFSRITDILNGPESIVMGALVEMSGDLHGSILLVQELEDASKLISMAMDAPYVNGKAAFTDMELSVITEVSNILVGSYLSAISTLTGLNIRATVPAITIDMAGAIMSVLAIEYSKVGDAVLFLETSFGGVDSLKGHFFLIPDLNSYNVMLKSLGMGG